MLDADNVEQLLFSMRCALQCFPWVKNVFCYSAARKRGQGMYCCNGSSESWCLSSIVLYFIVFSIILTLNHHFYKLPLSAKEMIDSKLLISDSKIVLGVNVCEWMSVSLCRPCDSLSMVYPNSRPMGDEDGLKPPCNPELDKRKKIDGWNKPMGAVIISVVVSWGRGSRFRFQRATK